MIDKKKRKEWSIFPNLSTIASYDILSQVIELNTIERRHIKELNSTFDVIKARDIFKIMNHEVTHYLDHISTLWGQRSLIKIYDALNALEQGNPQEFWKVIILYNDIRRQKFSKYYSVKNNNIIPPTANWHYRLSAGLQFDHNGYLKNNSPILFTQFLTPSGEIICRVPFTIESIIEANAMYAESYIEANFTNLLTPEEKLIEEFQINKNHMNWLFNPDLTVYSVAIHFAGNCCGLADIATAEYLSSTIGNICLNISDDYFDIVKIPESFSSMGDRNQSFITNKDRGYVYALIFQNILDNNLELDYSHFKNIDMNKILQNSNLPTKEIIYEKAFKELNTVYDGSIPGTYGSDLSFLLNMGRDYFLKRLKANSFGVQDMLNDNIMPPFVFADDNENTSQFYRWYWKISEFYDKMTDFKDACGY